MDPDSAPDQIEARIAHPPTGRRILAIAGAPVIVPRFERERDLADFWSLSVFLDTGPETLCERLSARWRAHGLTPDAARKRAEGNDLANAARIQKSRLPADLILGCRH